MTKNEIWNQIDIYNKRLLGVQMDLRGSLKEDLKSFDPEGIQKLAETCEQAAYLLRGISSEIGEFLAAQYRNTPHVAEEAKTELQLTNKNFPLTFESSRDVKIVEAITLASSLYKGGKKFIRLIKEIDR